MTIDIEKLAEKLNGEFTHFDHEVVCVNMTICNLEKLCEAYHQAKCAESEPVCNLWINPKTNSYEVDRLNHPASEIIPVYTTPQPDKVAELEEILQDQKRTIEVLNTCIGGECSLTTDNIRVVDMLEKKIADTEAGLEEAKRVLMLANEAMMWDVGGEPMPTLEIEARNEIKDLLDRLNGSDNG